MKRLMAIYLFLPLMLVQGETRTEVFAPFVSRLQAQPQESSILLTWKESRDVQGPRHIYRHTEEINQDNFSSAVYLGKLPADVNAYEDLPAGRESYFYAVLLEDPGGKVYEIFIPFRNITSRGVAVQTLPPEEVLAAEVTGLRAKVEGDGIQLEFKVSKPDRELLLFRSDSPLTGPQDLLGAKHPRVLEKNSKTVLDYPIPGVDVFYAVVDAGLYKIGKTVLVPGANSLTVPVRLPAGNGRVGLPAVGPTMRPTPLPYLLLTSGVESGRELSMTPSFLLPRDRQPLQQATSAALTNLLTALPELSVGSKQVELLAADRAGGDRKAQLPGEPVLQAILSDQLVPGDYESAAAQLKSFLSIPRPWNLESRARFYLGQAYYFQVRYSEAFFEFLSAREAHFTEAQPWLDACLFRLGEAGK